MPQKSAPAVKSIYREILEFLFDEIQLLKI